MPFQNCNKSENYISLLNFARLSKTSESSSHQITNSVYALNSLLEPTANTNRLLGTLAPLLYKSIIQENLQDQIRPEILSYLKKVTFQLVAKDIIQNNLLTQIVFALKQEGIPIILLKGAAFAGTLYPETAPRLGVDIDLLVKADKFERACSLLNKTMDVIVLDPNRMATHNTLFERVFTTRKDGGSIVEVHRGLTNPHLFQIEENELWEASRTHPAFQSEYIRILSPEDTLLHLAVHAFRDLDFCTHNLLDAHEVWCHWKPDPTELLVRAEKWKAKKVLYYLLTNCKMLMQTPIPDAVRLRLSPGSLCNAINKKLLTSETSNNVISTGKYHRIKQIISQITFTDKIWNGLKYQFVYSGTRLMDWNISRKNPRI